jgi:hypothetical protein
MLRILENLEQWSNERMVHQLQQIRFPSKKLEFLHPVKTRLRNSFQGNGAERPSVDSPENRRESARTDPVKDPIRTNERFRYTH